MIFATGARNAAGGQQSTSECERATPPSALAAAATSAASVDAPRASFPSLSFSKTPFVVASSSSATRGSSTFVSPSEDGAGSHAALAARNAAASFPSARSMLSTAASSEGPAAHAAPPRARDTATTSKASRAAAARSNVSESVPESVSNEHTALVADRASAATTRASCLATARNVDAFVARKESSSNVRSAFNSPPPGVSNGASASRNAPPPCSPNHSSLTSVHSARRAAATPRGVSVRSSSPESLAVPEPSAARSSARRSVERARGVPVRHASRAHSVIASSSPHAPGSVASPSANASITARLAAASISARVSLSTIGPPSAAFDRLVLGFFSVSGAVFFAPGALARSIARLNRLPRKPESAGCLFRRAASIAARATARVEGENVRCPNANAAPRPASAPTRASPPPPSSSSESLSESSDSPSSPVSPDSPSSTGAARAPHASATHRFATARSLSASGCFPEHAADADASRSAAASKSAASSSTAARKPGSAAAAAATRGWSSTTRRSKAPESALLLSAPFVLPPLRSSRSAASRRPALGWSSAAPSEAAWPGIGPAAEPASAWRRNSAAARAARSASADEDAFAADSERIASTATDVAAGKRVSNDRSARCATSADPAVELCAVCTSAFVSDATAASERGAPSTTPVSTRS
mmetsp:Transcript_8983/g.37747  ORF Transcript_8983/g.37747 Transcript_8983/m.37747 type:complete len:653 (+) Transcript_8983:1739-3697(+)